MFNSLLTFCRQNCPKSGLLADVKARSDDVFLAPACLIYMDTFPLVEPVDKSLGEVILTFCVHNPWLIKATGGQTEREGEWLMLP